MFSVDAAGLLLEGNDRWFEMTGHSRDKIFAMSWMETVHSDSIATIQEGWKIMTEQGIPWSSELVCRSLMFSRALQTNSV